MEVWGVVLACNDMLLVMLLQSRPNHEAMQGRESDTGHRLPSLLSEMRDVTAPVHLGIANAGPVIQALI